MKTWKTNSKRLAWGHIQATNSRLPLCGIALRKCHVDFLLKVVVEKGIVDIELVKDQFLAAEMASTGCTAHRNKSGNGSKGVMIVKPLNPSVSLKL
jgi:hypothetical protein